jgi:hypothetical protein
VVAEGYVTSIPDNGLILLLPKYGIEGLMEFKPDEMQENQKLRKESPPDDGIFKVELSSCLQMTFNAGCHRESRRSVCQDEDF